MNVEHVIELEKCVLRPYQAPIWQAVKKGYKRILAILPRRAGKDFCCWHILIRAALDSPGIYWFVYPTLSQGRKILWDGMTNDGKRFLSFIPRELIQSMNNTEMKIRLVNESIIQVCGSDSPDALVGTNPKFVVFSEYALQSPVVYQLIRPILSAQNPAGTAIFISTPRGKNHLWELWNIAQANTDQWFSYKMTVEQTGHISLSQIQREIDTGEMDEDLAKQEYYCSFDRGISGSFYGSYLDKAKLEGRITTVPHEPGLLTYCAIDIGVNDATTLIWYQIAGNVIRVIDCYSNHSVGLDHYVAILQERVDKYGYRMGKYFAPFDIKVREFGAGAITRYEQARQLGITFTVLEQLGLAEGINNVWMNFSRLWIDEHKCRSLINALENYRREWNEQTRRHKEYPIKNWACHYADALRYLVQSIPLITLRNSTPEELDRRFMEARYGSDMLHMPPVFQDRFNKGGRS